MSSLVVPDGVDGKALTTALREREGVIIAGGQDRLEGKILRIGHLGYVHEPDITACMDALERQLRAQGYRVPVDPGGAAVAE